MAAKELETPEINFASDDSLENRPGGKLLSWALTYGKAAIVLTELVVVGAFLSRFALDSTIADLNEQITKKQAIVVASAQFEAKFRAFSRQVSVASELLSQLPPDQIVDATLALIPQGIVISNLSVRDYQVSFAGSASDEASLSVLSSAFRDSAKFSQVYLERIDKTDKKAGGTPGIAFAMNVRFKGQPGGKTDGSNK